jgi:curved DNA-binding protein CbpA
MRRFILLVRNNSCASQRLASEQRGNRKSSDLADCHKRLGLALGATSAEIKAAYRQKALECHPDVVPLSDKAAAESEFRRVSEAYAILSNEVRFASAGEPLTTSYPTGSTQHNYSVRNRAAKQEGSKGPTSPGWQSQQSRKGPFVRKDADRFFRDAFDGKTIDDIMFQARLRDRRANRRRQMTAGDREQKPVGHEEVLRHVMSNAAQQFADRLAKEYGHDTVKNTRFFRFRGASKQPPSTTLSFQPFIGLSLPPGVEAPGLPTPGKPTHISHENLEQIHEPSHQPRRSIELVMPKGSLQSSIRSQVFDRNRKSSFMSHNAGQVYSYHRAY